MMTGVENYSLNDNCKFTHEIIIIAVNSILISEDAAVYNSSSAKIYVEWFGKNFSTTIYIFSSKINAEQKFLYLQPPVLFIDCSIPWNQVYVILFTKWLYISKFLLFSWNFRIRFMNPNLFLKLRSSSIHYSSVGAVLKPIYHQIFTALSL